MATSRDEKLACSVAGFRDVLDYTEYVVVTDVNNEKGRQRFVEHHRFSDFTRLHDLIQGELGLAARFPVAKRTRTGLDVKRTRVLELGRYLRTAVAVAEHVPPPALLAFLGVHPEALGRGGVDAVGGDHAAIAKSPLRPEGTLPALPAASTDLELSKDVYSTAFVLASNATEGMYSFSPWANRQIRVLWVYLTFIVASQAFALACLVWLLPPVVDTTTMLIDCDATPVGGAAAVLLEAAAAVSGRGRECDGTPTAFDGDGDGGIGVGVGVTLSPAAAAYCRGLDIEMSWPRADGSGGITSFRRVEHPTYFYQNVFKASFRGGGGGGGGGPGGMVLGVLQLICCVWVTVQVYFVDFASVERLLAYRDFSQWLLPLKGETPQRSGWVLVIPLLQWTLACGIVGVSCCLTCACTSGFDAVMNALAFTFISTVAEVFNTPLLQHYARTPIHGLDPAEYGTAPIYYLVSEYDEANAYGEPADWLTSWYIKEGEEVAGLVTDFHVRHDPDAYPRPKRHLANVLRGLFWCVPAASLAACCALQQRV